MLTLLASIVLQSPPPVAYSVREIQGMKCDVIQADLTDRRVRASVAVAEGFPGTDETFSSMVKRWGLVAAVNGAYFDKGTKKPIGDIWVDGRLLNLGMMGTAIGFRADGSVDIRRVQRHKRVDWSEFESVLACGPALVLDGKVDCDWGAEGFRDPSVTGRVPRMGVGYTKSGKLLLVHLRSAVTFERFAQVMHELGCHEAMNLDAGASLAMWFQGRTIRKPGRRLTNLLVIERRAEPR